VRVSGKDRRELFAEAARSVFELSARPRKGWPEKLETREVAVQAGDEVALLKRLLSDCLFLFESEGFLAREVLLERLEPTDCRARLTGASFGTDELEIDHVIKAVTWHGLAIREERDGVSAEVLHDL
jgi:SHS2 domain-containing protein